LLGRGPEAVEMVTNEVTTVLHLACREDYSIAVVQYLYNCWAVASLVVAFRESRPMLPHGCAVGRQPVADVTDFVAEATKDTACALIEYALYPLTSMPVTERDRMRDFVTALNISGFDASASGVALTESVRRHLTCDSILNLVNNDALQQLLLGDKDLQRTIGGLVRMNKAGRNYVQGEPSNVCKGIAVLDFVSDNVDCIFVHLRENVLLVSR
jgi:hypothetical protein